jgi:hypothetical protein
MNPAIVAWLLLAINAWGAAPIPREEREQVAAYRRQVAEDVAAVAYDPNEPSFYSGPYGRASTALTIVSIAALETRFVERIALGHCRPKECDHGKAVGLMQAHPGPHGMRLWRNEKPVAEQCGADSAECWDVQDLAQDPVEQIRAGLHILRVQGFGAFTRASDMRAQAVEWMGKHPPPVADALATLRE